MRLGDDVRMFAQVSLVVYYRFLDVQFYLYDPAATKTNPKA